VTKAALLAAAVLASSFARAELGPEAAARNAPVAPFQIVDHVYYVGAADIASYLVSTTDGLILLDGGYAETAAQIEHNVKALGFELHSIRWLLIGHAHPDHAGGLAMLKRDTGARLAALREEKTPLQNAGRGTFYRGERSLFESVKVDRAVADGATLRLGEQKLTVRKTAGHTPGCATWTMTTTHDGHPVHIVFACQLTVPAGMRLRGDPAYPDMAADFRQTFARLRSLPCDVFLSEHGSVFDLAEKRRALDSGAKPNPFIDAAGCKRAIDTAEREFQHALEQETRGVGT
jgi:metallo-beta-lactamase class B